MANTYDLEHAQESLRNYDKDELVDIAVTLSEFATANLLWRAMEDCCNSGMIDHLRGRVSKLEADNHSKCEAKK